MKTKVTYPADDVVNYGDIVVWVNGYTRSPCLVAYECIINLENPAEVWSISITRLRGRLARGEFKKVPAGTVIEITQE